jgi:hypothetical protein
MDSSLRNFIAAHADDDVSALLLKGAGTSGVDIREAALQIEARRKAKSKIPTFAACPDFCFPTSISVEQCSSEAAARFKTRFLPDSNATLFDLTGGLGADSYFFSLSARRVFYFEKNPALCEAAKANFKALGATNIIVRNTDCEDMEAISGTMRSDSALPDLIFIDPSRRDSNSNRKYALQDCSPNVPSLLESLFAICPRVLVKASPMLDISFISRLFPSCSKIVALSVDNECKEVLMLLEKGHPGSEPQITAADLKGTGGSIEYEVNASISEEREAAASFEVPGKAGRQYLYQPGKAMLKAGFFKLPCSRFGVRKIDSGTHLYIGNELVPDFPGKAFIILETMDFNRKGMEYAAKAYPKASLTAVNVPMTTAEFKSRTRIEDGGNIHLFACGSRGGNIIIAAEPYR